MRVRSVVASAIGLVVGCHGDPPKEAPPDAARPVVSAAASSVAPAHPPVPAPPPTSAVKPPACRIVSGEGEGAPSPTADATKWLDLGPKARFAVRVTESGKEIRFEGPGRVRPCGGDVALVAEGSVVGLPGGGEAAGNEQWAANGCAVARWAGGVHRLTTEKDGCILQVSTGTAWLWIPEGARVEEAREDAGAPAPDGGAALEPTDGWRRVDARRTLRVRSGPGPTTATAAVLACEKAIADVDALAAKMTADGGAGSVGELLPKSIAARKYARAACSVAAVRASDAKADPALVTRVEKALARL